MPHTSLCGSSAEQLALAAAPGIETSITPPSSDDMHADTDLALTSMQVPTEDVAQPVAVEAVNEEVSCFPNPQAL
jgi:hypothetical protein